MVLSRAPVSSPAAWAVPCLPGGCWDPRQVPEGSRVWQEMGYGQRWSEATG